MLDTLLNWLASLRIRLIVTYVLVTAISFGFLLILLSEPLEDFLLKRETDKLVGISLTLASTIPDPTSTTEESFKENLWWTQRRCQMFLKRQRELQEIRIRVLDAGGVLLTDSDAEPLPSYDAWTDWMAAHQTEPPEIRKRREVVHATREAVPSEGETPYETVRDRIAGEHGGRYSIYIAQPIFRRDRTTGENHLAFIMYLSTPVDAIQKNLHDLRGWIVFGLFASLLVTIMVSILVSSNLAAGLHSAMQIAQGFAAGRMDVRMSGRGRDEVGQLGKAFNQMADALQRQEQLRRNLLADVSHELRTPLTAISGCADTLADGTLRDDPEAAERFLGIIVRESQRLQRLVSDILELSRLQAGAVAIPRHPMPLLRAVDEAVEIARMHARQDGVQIAWERPAHLIEDELLVQGNEDRLAQALRNVLDNARHHTPAGKQVTVSIELAAAWVIVHVADEGEGIPPEDIPWVFDRFYRAGKGAKPGGTGLGLAIVREILQAHEGRVTVESALGQGTTFSLHVPRVCPGETKKGEPR